MITVELTAAIDSSGTLQTFYLSEAGYTTLASDVPSNISFESRLIDPGTIGITAFSDGKTGGASQIQTGEITIANTDGGLDAWINYSFDGRPVIIKTGDPSAAYSTYTNVLYGTVDSIEVDWDKIIIRLKDKQFRLQKPVLTTVYLGNNSLPNGLEGTATDLLGKVKPKTYGQVFNVSPPLVNTSRLIYEVGVCNSVDAVYSRGNALTKGADYTSQSDMETNAPTSGQYRTWPGGGYFRINYTLDGLITADVTAGSNAAARTAAQLYNQFALASGLLTSEISSSDVSALDTLNSAVCGIWINDNTTTFEAAITSVLSSVGGWFGFDYTGTLRVGRLTDPFNVTPGTTLQLMDLGETITRKVPSDNGIPTWQVNLNYQKIFTTQTSDIAGAALAIAGRQGYLANQFRTYTSADSTILTQWQQSVPLNRDTLLTTLADATTEANRLLTLYKVRRDMWEVTIDLSVFTANQMKLMDIAILQVPRYGMTYGKSFRIIGYAITLLTSKVVLTLWG
jgi:hypothetical protein